MAQERLVYSTSSTDGLTKRLTGDRYPMMILLTEGLPDSPPVVAEQARTAVPWNRRGPSC